ncbi:MAG: iron-containing alcohol dehydrogenase [Spirochaetaceae bacterium]|nr:MAG: iron-containing alcohol dehydrogenase [Spirochaetaceae bacterium]
MTDLVRAKELIHEFKGDSYIYGSDVLEDVGNVVARVGGNAALVYSRFPGVEEYLHIIRGSLAKAGVELAAELEGARPNCPREDLFRITEQLKTRAPDVVITFGGGSTIDAGKAAEMLRTLGGEIDSYFGTGLVTEALQRSGLRLHPHLAIQTAASSAAHLTKYSNITDLNTGQKKLVVDEAIVPSHPVFDHRVTYAAPRDLTTDGALDGIAHVLEVFYGAVGKPLFEKIKDVALTAISLVVNNLPAVLANPENKESREALCLATDLGGYAIMLGGTNGGHLTSFSLVDILSHGRACAMMNPYYSVFFAPAIEEPLRLVGALYREAGYIQEALDDLYGRELGIAVADGMFAFSRKIGFPTRLTEVKGFSDAHIERALSAAKNPQLKMKLENMPVPLNADMIDEYMGPILKAARDGDLSYIRTVS